MGWTLNMRAMINQMLIFSQFFLCHIVFQVMITLANSYFYSFFIDSVWQRRKGATSLMRWMFNGIGVVRELVGNDRHVHKQYPSLARLSENRRADSICVSVYYTYKEKLILFNKGECSGDKFSCDGRCMNKNLRCDGFYDCNDEADEKGCCTCKYIRIHFLKLCKFTRKLFLQL